MRAHTFSANQFAALAEAWWEKWNGNKLSAKLQSQTGVYVIDQGVVLAIAYLYPTVGSQMVYLGFTVRDPELSRERADEALRLLLNAAEQTTLALGYSIIQSTYESESMQKRVAALGYAACGKTQIFVKDLNNGKTS